MGGFSDLLGSSESTAIRNLSTILGDSDFSKYLSKGGLFEKFKYIEFFKNFKIHDELGVLTWGDEVDIAPETLLPKQRIPLFLIGWIQIIKVNSSPRCFIKPYTTGQIIL